ncbi:hypothetical protein RRG08_052051 [Elysia crispata]|uniref:Sulfatase N-terminal domain-containing protein n=1 Tax=Elysia crispata TaxID=231223 RepID=A0AAE1A3Y6_9GAST|nr:hypothetical protein RRG08_052051 [Elysia crispata]
MLLCATVACAVLLVTQVSEASITARGNVQKPNIIFILADDYGFNDIGYHGSQIKTPTLDQLAGEGVKLENYYVQPRCSPTRSQLMSGRYQIHTGLQHEILWRWQRAALPRNSPTIADKLKETGYSTHMIGKWHLGFYKEEYLPQNRGFDTFFGYLSCMEDYYRHTSGWLDNKHYYLDLRDNNGPVRTEDGHYSTHTFTERAENIISRHATNASSSSSPLFLYMAYQAVHWPLQVPEAYEKKYSFIKDEKRRKYAGMVDTLDEGVRNITRALRQAGMWENTILVFSTDNGGQVKQGGNNFPLRGWKGSLFEGGIRGVGFVSGGALETRGVVNRELIHVSDWFPTLVKGVAGGSLNGTLPLDGFNQWPTITGRDVPTARPYLLHNIDILYGKHGKKLYPHTWDTRVRAAIRVGDLKLITGQPDNGSWVKPPGDQSLPHGDVILSKDDKNKNVWLFNITADPTEHHDLSEKFPEHVRHMLDMILAINGTAVPPNYPRPDPASNPALHGGVWGPWVK